jgi:putative acetyltransferase
MGLFIIACYNLIEVTDVEIRQVPYTDYDLQTLVQELDDFFLNAWGQQVAGRYQSLHQLSLMAYECVCYEKEPIGCGCLKHIDAQNVEIKRMYVRAKYRRQGVATQILQHLETVAINNGYRYCLLETGKDMQDNILFYEKCGYYLVDNFGDFIGDDICICMKKDLNSN